MSKLGLTIAAASVAVLLNGEATAARMANPLSSFEAAAIKLKFETQEQQAALLKIFYYAGYLDPHRLWADLNRIEGIKDHAAEAFKLIYPALIEAHADQRDVKQFHPEILSQKLCGGLSETESADLLLYIAQHAFNRKLGQERNELKAQNWMTEYQAEYMEAAKVLGLINRIEPSFEAYDEGWIAGASRIGVLARVIDYFNTITSKGVVINGETSVLAGGRELWAEIDGITPQVLEKLTDARERSINIDQVDISLPIGNNEERTEEGKRYLVTLAERDNIALNPEMPLIKFAAKSECPAGREPNRWYPNYAGGEGRKLNESLMSQDVLKTIAGSKNVMIVDTAPSADGIRSNTISTAADAAQKIAAKIKLGEYGTQKTFVILFESNQPYIERQTLATQAAADAVFTKEGLTAAGYKALIDGIGFGNKQDVATIHSELGALFTEKMKVAIASGMIPPHDLKPLLFQSRDSDAPVPNFPDVSAWHPIHVDLGGAEAKPIFQ